MNDRDPGGIRNNATDGETAPLTPKDEDAAVVECITSNALLESG